MEIKVFIENYRKAFGDTPTLPIVFWHSDTPENQTDKINGCFFKGIKQVNEGVSIALDIETIGCGGGKFYTGFTDMPEMIPNFVSLKEKYKQTPELVIDYLDGLQVPRTDFKHLNFARIDKVDSFDRIEGILFLANPDVLSGLTTWAYFDNNSEDAVSSIFSSGCCAVVTLATIENRKNGRRTFLGFFDPSVRPHVDANVLSYMIPMSRFKEMYATMTDSCLFDTHAWKKIRERINLESE